MHWLKHLYLESAKCVYTTQSIYFISMFLLDKEQSYVCTYNYNVIKKEENKNQADSDHDPTKGSTTKIAQDTLAETDIYLPIEKPRAPPDKSRTRHDKFHT